MHSETCRMTSSFLSSVSVTLGSPLGHLWVTCGMHHDVLQLLDPTQTLAWGWSPPCVVRGLFLNMGDSNSINIILAPGLPYLVPTWVWSFCLKVWSGHIRTNPTKGHFKKGSRRSLHVTQGRAVRRSSG